MNFENDWKAVTLWIGANDLCHYFKNDRHVPEKYISSIRHALDLLHQKVPKVFVNLVQVLDVTILSEIQSLYCKTLHFITCYCGTFAGDVVKMKVSEAVLEYPEARRRLSELWKVIILYLLCNYKIAFLTLLPTEFYNFLSYGGGGGAFLSHTPENNVKII